MRKKNTRQAFTALYSAARAGEFGLFYLRTNNLKPVMGEAKVYRMSEAITSIIKTRDSLYRAPSLTHRLSNFKCLKHNKELVS